MMTDQSRHGYYQLPASAAVHLRHFDPAVPSEYPFKVDTLEEAWMAAMVCWSWPNRTALILWI
jgi:hypothetical protein